jgi:protein phosphatase 2C family protein 2/3
MFTRDPSGCTAVAALITHDKKLIVANAGDSRSVISVAGEVKPMSYDHKPQSEVEKARISAAGGYVEYGRVNGNLALSRALGDFEYKKNPSLSPEAQIITANPDIIEHSLTDEDEFLVIACDGIWDCLSSQQVVDVVRRKVCEGVQLGEIAEQICDLCLAPDTTSGAGIGCDNMTILVVAILNGKTLEEWYSWIGERVRNNHGYWTPAQMPQIFAQSRILAFQARQKAQKERDERDRQEGRGMGNPLGVGGLLGSSALGGFARVLGSTGGISFHPGSGIISDTGTLMFDKYDSDEDDSDEDMDPDAVDADGQSFFNDSFGGGNSDSNTKSLRAQLAELEDSGDEEHIDVDEVENAGEVNGKTSATAGPTRGETPPPPLPSASGVVGTEPVSQLQTPPGGDKPEPVVKVEGLMDKSEDPLKG